MNDTPVPSDAPEDDVVWFDDVPRPVVAIDGPAGSGKSTVAARVAAALDVPHVDTGALYRAAALACLRAGVDLTDGAACTSVVVNARIDRDDVAGRTYLDGEDVEDEIRGPEATAAVSAVSAHHGVRSALTPAQRRAVADGGVVEGRDIGTVVLPDADVKVFLTASVEERARRRGGQVGRDDLETITAELIARDDADGSREVAPLVRADDAWELVTDGLEVDEVVDLVVARVAEVTAGVDPDEDVQRPTVDPLTARRALPRVAVVGRPNVGKSTLVNRILGRRVTIVEEKPGVTRDRTEHRAEWLGRPFLVVDTGGWEHAASSAGRDHPVEGMSARIVEQAEAAIASADVVLFIVDVTVGALEDDERYAKLLRRSGTPTVLAANKVDAERQEALVHELWNLGLDEPHPVSARHGRGVGDLLDVVVAAMPAPPEDLAGAISDEDAVPRVALVGKPNVGKSSLFNRLLGEERSIVDAVPHTTRDAVDTMVEVDGEPWIFVDTAGMRRRYRTGEDTELFSVDRTRAAIEQADLVLFLLDASEGIGEQDQRLAALLRDAGRAFVLVCNKWDLVDDERREDLEKELDRLLSFAKWAPRINVSALSGRGLRRVMPQLRSVWTNYRRRVPTRELNRLLADAVAHQAPPRRGQKQLKLRYATQAETRPPRFVLFTNGTLPPGYKRYLERELREHHDFTGVPLLLDDRPPAQRENKRERRQSGR
ncbi:ribosome biogenesis GTPase Der [Nitriliruptor alkaliphilus]|uniref:ribosome biogenesis GTPase Der n=1 Tax=Nitriliruptor alkaliphilus TaxID=427918 RepID=UPI00069612F9|nr:ribosome biogenesis GTPase Der [Nitriliruptor alkaliphilus]